jgi:hypothetical protein
MNLGTHQQHIKADIRGHKGSGITKVADLPGRRFVSQVKILLHDLAKQADRHVSSLGYCLWYMAAPPLPLRRLLC